MASGVLLAVLGACREAPEDGTLGGVTRAVAEAQSKQKPADDQSTDTVKTKMGRHDATVELMRRAIVAGDVKTLATAAGELSSDRWLPNAKSEWARHLASVRGAADRASKATTVEAAAAALAEVGSTCAGCHQAVGGPKPPLPLAPPAGEREPVMLAHQAAVDELWSGLVTPDAAAWQRGARALAEAPFAATGKPEAAKAVGNLRATARDSVDVPADVRPAQMARVLANCAQCHRLHAVSGAQKVGD